MEGGEGGRGECGDVVASCDNAEGSGGFPSFFRAHGPWLTPTPTHDTTRQALEHVPGGKWWQSWLVVVVVVEVAVVFGVGRKGREG